jgi:hypothetical protein
MTIILGLKWILLVGQMERLMEIKFRLFDKRIGRAPRVGVEEIAI